jgi:hypothetical protein
MFIYIDITQKILISLRIRGIDPVIPEILSTYLSAKVGLCDRDLENFKFSRTFEGLARLVT